MRMALLNEDDYSNNPADRYTFIEQIGIGGMGVVHRVYDRYYQRIIALKKLKPEWLKQPAMVEQFQREPRLIYSFYHPGIIPVLDVGTYNDGSPYFTMPIIQGETLRSALKTLYREVRSDHLDGVRTLISRFVRS